MPVSGIHFFFLRFIFERDGGIGQDGNDPLLWLIVKESKAGDFTGIFHSQDMTSELWKVQRDATKGGKSPAVS